MHFSWINAHPLSLLFTICTTRTSVLSGIDDSGDILSSPLVIEAIKAKGRRNEMKENG